MKGDLNYHGMKLPKQLIVVRHTTSVPQPSWKDVLRVQRNYTNVFVIRIEVEEHVSVLLDEPHHKNEFVLGTGQNLLW